jgi:solute carrier family 40 (iron-regulated transporter), member 1
MLVLVVLLACIEKLCSIMNMVAVEKDWVSLPSRGHSVETHAHSIQSRLSLWQTKIPKLSGP